LSFNRSVNIETVPTYSSPDVASKNTPISKLKDAPGNYAIPKNIITLFQLYGYFQVNDKSRYIMNDAEDLLDSVCFSMGVNEEKDVFNLHPFFETTKISYATPNKYPGTYAFLHPLWCVLNYYVKVPSHLTTPLTVTIEMLQGKCFDTPTEPRITMVTLPRLPNKICDWFKWRYEAQTIIVGSGGGRILTDHLFALQNPHDNKMVPTTTLSTSLWMQGNAKMQVKMVSCSLSFHKD
jgi:hypothetical protein